MEPLGLQQARSNCCMELLLQAQALHQRDRWLSTLWIQELLFCFHEILACCFLLAFMCFQIIRIWFMCWHQGFPLWMELFLFHVCYFMVWHLAFQTRLVDQNQGLQLHCLPFLILFQESEHLEICALATWIRHHLVHLGMIFLSSLASYLALILLIMFTALLIVAQKYFTRSLIPKCSSCWYLQTLIYSMAKSWIPFCYQRYQLATASWTLVPISILIMIAIQLSPILDTAPYSPVPHCISYCSSMLSDMNSFYSYIWVVL